MGRKTRVGFALAIVVPILLAGCSSAPSYDPYQRQDTNSLTVPPGAGKGVEFKLYVRQGDAFEYTWSATRGLNYDFHGEKEGDRSGAFTSHKKGIAGSDSGSHTATFTGTHGWYWENAWTEPVTVTIKTDGLYDVVGETGKKH